MPPFRCDTIETCDGIVCRHCHLWPDMCTCNPAHALRQIFQGMTERISGQGWIPQTPEREGM